MKDGRQAELELEKVKAENASLKQRIHELEGGLDKAQFQVPKKSSKK